MNALALGNILILLMAAGILAALVRRGAFSAGAFRDAPPRRGRLGLFDLLVAFGLMILGGSVAAVLMQRIGPVDSGNGAGAMLWRMLASQAGMLPAILYTLIRAAAAMEGGLGGFGLGVRRPVRAVSIAVLGAAVVIPLTLAASSVIVMVLTALGRQPPMIAHETLRVLVESPWGPARWGLILSAVLLAPVLEEILFRGLLQTSLLHSGVVGGRWGVILIASALFALIHAGIADPQALPTLFVLAVGLGYAYERSGSLWAPIGIHAIFNTLQITIVLSSTLAPEALPQ